MLIFDEKIKHLCKNVCNHIREIMLRPQKQMLPELAFTVGPGQTFLEIDHQIISNVILLPSNESFKKGCCQLQTKVCA